MSKELIDELLVLVAVGLILPAAFDIPILVPLAAVGLILKMIGAGITHARRNEFRKITVNVVLLALAAVVAWARFGAYTFRPDASARELLPCDGRSYHPAELEPERVGCGHGAGANP